MKYFNLFFLLFVSVVAMCQTDSIYVYQSNDTTFVKGVISFDEEGRKVSEVVEYYDSTGFQDFLFDQVVNVDNAHYSNLQAITESEKSSVKSLKQFNEIKDYYFSFSGKNYGDVLTDKLKQRFSGDWKLIVKGVVFNVENNENDGVNSLKIFSDKNSDKRAKLSFLQKDILRLRKIGTSEKFFDEVFLEEKEIRGKRRYIGFMDDGTKVILRR